jgi:hypothetical protein
MAATGSVILVAAVLLACSPRGARAACPQDICDCIGEAAKFDVVATRILSMKPGVSGYAPYTYASSAVVVDDGCATKARILGTEYAVSEIDDLFLLQGPGAVAGRFRTNRGYGYPGTWVLGDLATGGGKIAGGVDVSGSLDTTGTHPRLPECAQAVADAQSASASLAALTPTMDLGRLVVRGEYLTIPVGPGVQVITASHISLLNRPYYGYRYGAILQFDLDAGTEAVILNTGGLIVDRASAIYGPDDQMIINVPGPGPTVVLKREATVTPGILAPERRIFVDSSGDLGFITNLFGEKVQLRGAIVNGALEDYCQ